MGRFYGVGVGPGDLELITMKGFRVLQEAVSSLPRGRSPGGQPRKRKIVEKILGKEKEFVELKFPMIKDENRTRPKVLSPPVLSSRS